MNPVIPPHLMKRKEVAAEFRVDLGTVGRWLKEGRLPFIRLGKAIRIRRTDVQKYLDSQTVPKRSAAAEQRPQISA